MNAILIFLKRVQQWFEETYARGGQDAVYAVVNIIIIVFTCFIK
ncbi:hypothetical protein [Lactobacillus johnsonii]|nr:hypothetical protein [Lactobacillus johnsonii]